MSGPETPSAHQLTAEPPMTDWQRAVWIRAQPERDPDSPGKFEIRALDAGGLVFETVDAVGPTGTMTEDQGVHLTDKERADLGSAVRREMGFRPKDATGLREARTEMLQQEETARSLSITGLRALLHPRQARQARHARQDADAARVAFETKRQAHIAGGKKVGIRDIEVDGNVVRATVVPVQFQTYNILAGTRDSEERRVHSSVMATTMIVRTADSKFVLQHRGAAGIRENGARKMGNASYMDVPGGSAAGLMDAHFSSKDRQKGTVDPITEHDLMNNALKEMGEELGLGAEDLVRGRFVGLAEERQKSHEEALIVADSGLTSSEIVARSRSSNRNKNLPPADFDEKFVFVDASIQTIERLLVESRCPVPPSHAAAFLAAGYMMMVEAGHDKETADNWRHQVELAANANYDEIDRVVQDFYSEHPEALAQVSERFWGRPIPPRNPHGYDQARTPEEQGLPSFEDEMIRLGLIEDDRTHVDTAYLFDVDGVLTNPTTKEINPDVMSEIFARLEEGSPVTLNTGRSTSWVLDRLSGYLESLPPEAKHMLTIIGEKGCTWVSFDEDGNPFGAKTNAIGSIPDTLRDRVLELIDSESDPGNPNGMLEPLDLKQTMLSIEMRTGADLDEFRTYVEGLQVKIDGVLAELGLIDTYKSDRTTIALDIEGPYVGKALGAERMLGFLSERGIKARRFVAYGDSISDADMAGELTRRGQDVSFVYVGDRSGLEELRRLGRSHYWHQFTSYNDPTGRGEHAVGTLQDLRRRSGEQ